MRYWTLLTLTLLLACDEATVDTALIQIPATGSAAAPQPRRLTEKAVFTPTEAEHDYGTVVEGTIVEHTFTFTNTGNAPLLIADVSSGCGCTVPQNWTRELIPPGEGGSIEVTFDTRGWSGKVDKRVTAVTNGEPAVVHLVLNGNILSPEGERTPSPMPIRRH